MDQNTVETRIRLTIQWKKIPKNKGRNYKKRKEIYMPNISPPSRGLNLEKVTTFPEILFPSVMDLGLVRRIA